MASSIGEPTAAQTNAKMIQIAMKRDTCMPPPVCSSLLATARTTRVGSSRLTMSTMARTVGSMIRSLNEPS